MLAQHQWIALVAVVFAASPAIGAVDERDEEGAKDHRLVSRIKGAFIRDYYHADFDLAKVPVDRIDDQDAPGDALIEVEGELTQHEYELPENVSAYHALTSYRSALTQGGFDILFECVGEEECGDDLRDVTRDMDRVGAAGSRPKVAITGKRAVGDGRTAYVYAYIDGGKPMGVFQQVVISGNAEQLIDSVSVPALSQAIESTGQAVVAGVYFDTDKAVVKAESHPALATVADFLAQRPGIKLYVAGHTDNIGTLDHNMDLSRRRAAAVQRYLVGEFGVAPDRLDAHGLGPLAPAASNDSEAGRSQNRRVAIVKQ